MRPDEHRSRVVFAGFSEDESQAASHALGPRHDCATAEALEPGAEEGVAVVFAAARRGVSPEGASAWLRNVRGRFPRAEFAILEPSGGGFPVADSPGAGASDATLCRLNLDEAFAKGCAQLVRAAAFLSKPVEAFDPRSLLPGAHWRREALVTRADKRRLVEMAAEEFDLFSRDPAGRSQVELCAEESVNNALFHAFRLPTGEEKYTPKGFTVIEPRDRVDVWTGADPFRRLFAIAVEDNAGSLALETLRDKLRYSQSRESLFLERGRGLFLMRSCASEMYIAVAPGRRTLAALLFGEKFHEDAPSPLLARWGASPPPPSGGPSAGAPAGPEGLRPEASPS